MTCTRHFLNFEWERHSWHRRVSAAETAPNAETNMWGRVVNGDYVRCRKHDVCDACGKTRDEVNCFCDTAYAAHCPIRLTWIDESERTMS